MIKKRYVVFMVLELCDWLSAQNPEKMHRGKQSDDFQMPRYERYFKINCIDFEFLHGKNH
jgi:hypothetical protein